MNIIDLVNKNNDSRAKKSAQPQQPKSPRSEYLDLKKDLPKEVQADIANFRGKYPQLKEHVIFRIMRKHEMKMNLVEPELKFNAEMQGTQPVEEREPRPKRPFVPREPRFPQESKKPVEPRKKGDGEPTGQVEPKNEAGAEARDNPKFWRKESDRAPGRFPENKDKKFRQNGEWQGRPRDPNFRPQNAQHFEPRDGQTGQQPGFGNRGSDQAFQQKRQYNKKNGPKRPRGQWDSRDDSDEYVARQAEDEKPKSVKPPPEEYQQRALSNINEESDDHSHHRLHVGDSNEKVKFGKTQPAGHDLLRQGQGGERGGPVSSVAGKSEHQAVSAPHAGVNGHPKGQHGESGAASQKHARQASPEEKFRPEEAAEGLSVVAKFFQKKIGANLRQLVESARTLEIRAGKGEGRSGHEKRPAFVEGKKRKPATKKNFETEENDESNNERAKKLNLHVGTKRFESEEERMKGDRERAIEVRLGEAINHINFLSQKVKALEDELAALRSAQDQAEAKNGEENVFCMVPFHVVRDQYPFSSIKVSEVKSGTVYFVKKD